MGPKWTWDQICLWADQWCTLVTPAVWEAEPGGSQIGVWPGQFSKNLSHIKWVGDVSDCSITKMHL